MNDTQTATQDGSDKPPPPVLQLAPIAGPQSRVERFFIAAQYTMSILMKAAIVEDLKGQLFADAVKGSGMASS